MSSARHHCSGLRERLGYVQCNFCSTVLLVSVPCSSVLRVVAVQCGHCSGILSAVNLPPLPLPSVELPPQELDVGPRREYSDESSGDDREGGDAEDDAPAAAVVPNKPPGRRQRTPSAYNCFVKEEIKRIKGMEPNITHKQAFSTAAKNWAHLPRIQQKRG